MILFISRDARSAKLFRACLLMGYRTIIARYVAKWGIAQIRLYETKYQGGYRTILGEYQPPLKSIARDGVSQR